MNGQLDAMLTIEGLGDVLLQRVRVVEATSQVTRAVVEAATNEAFDFAPLVGNRAAVTVLEDRAVRRRWTMLLTRAAFVEIRDGAHRWELTLHAPLHALRLKQTTRKFRDSDVVAIVAHVLSEASIDHAFELSSGVQVRPYCVQYRESHLDFISRLLEHDGIYSVCRDDGGLSLSDRSSAAALVDDGATFELVASEGALVDGAPAIHEIADVAAAASDAATVHDIDWKKPNDSLIASAGDTESALEVYDFPTGYRTVAEGARLAELRLQALRAEAHTLEGRADVKTFRAGARFRFGGLLAEAAQLSGEYFLIEVEHEVAYREAGVSYANRFRAIPSAVPYRPALRTPRRRVGGTHTAFVRGPSGSEIHTDVHGRFKAQFHWDREAKGDDTDSRWMRMLQEISTSMFLARVGWEVQVAYHDGDADRPIGLARLINGAMPPIYPQPARKTVMTIRTPSSPATGGYNELMIDDLAGAMTIDVRAERDMLTLVRHDRTEIVGHCESHYVGASLSRDVTRDQQVDIGGSSTTTVGASHVLLVNGDRDKTVGGNEAVTVAEGSDSLISGDDVEVVGGWRKTTAGTSKPGSIGRSATAEFTRSVGGSHVVRAGGNIEVQAGLGLSEKIAGSRVTVAKNGDITQGCGGPLTVEVGGAVIATIKGDVGLSAREASTEVRGDTTLTSAKRVRIRGDTIEVAAEREISFVQGKLSMKLKPDLLAFKGDVKLTVPSGEVVVFGRPVNITRLEKDDE